MRNLFCEVPGTSRVHLEKSKAGWKQNFEYCTKDDTRIPGEGHGPWEFGERPAGQGRRTDLQLAAETALLHGDVHEVIIKHPVEYVKYHRGLTKLCEYYGAPRDFKTRVYWYYGPTGSGKSRAAYDEALRFCQEEQRERSGVAVRDSIRTLPYFKPAIGGWWDFYVGQSTVIINDLRADTFGFVELLRVFDRYPMLIPRKGDYVQFRGRAVWVTCPMSPVMMFQNETCALGEDLGQLLRRIERVCYFPALGEEPVFKHFTF